MVQTLCYEGISPKGIPPCTCKSSIQLPTLQVKGRVTKGHLTHMEGTHVLHCTIMPTMINTARIVVRMWMTWGANKEPDRSRIYFSLSRSISIPASTLEDRVMWWSAFSSTIKGAPHGERERKPAVWKSPWSPGRLHLSPAIWSRTSALEIEQGVICGMNSTESNARSKKPIFTS